MTPLSEGVIQARGQGGERGRFEKHDVVLVTGNGGILGSPLDAGVVAVGG